MTLAPEERLNIVALRLENADRMLKDAHLLLEAGSLRSAVNRVYYAMFYAASALAVSRGRVFSTHKGLIVYLQREFVKTGVLDRQHGRTLQKAFENRTEGDYQDLVRFSSADVARMLSDAEEFVQATTALCRSAESPGPPAADDVAG